MFCGAGGSSQGVRRLAQKMNGGIEVKLAMNHWKLAIETHNTNFPETLHDCTDISACDPRRYPSTNIGLFSPECTTHSPAGGNNHKSLKKQMELFNTNKIDPATERSRQTMWDVCRFAEYHKYEGIIVENVVEAKTRWPLFDAWLNAMHILGYNHRCVYLNSMHCHPTPQSRDRMYIVFWKKGNNAPNLDFTPSAYCPCCEANVLSIQVWKKPNMKFGKYRQQYYYACPVHGIKVDPYYYASFNIIDWSDRGTRIGDREKPLAPKTTQRINYGIDKYGSDPLVLPINGSEHSRGIIRSVKNTLGTQTSFAGSQALVSPFIVNAQQQSGIDCRVRGAQEVMQTIPASVGMRVVIPPPFIIDGGFDFKPSRVKTIDKELMPQTTQQTAGVAFPEGMPNEAQGVRGIGRELSCQTTAQTAGVVFQNKPLIVENKGWSRSTPSTHPLSTATTVGYQGLFHDGAINAFLSAYHHGSDVTKHITQESSSFPTKDSVGLTTFQKPLYEDCFYRMLKPGEIKLGMAFDRDYVVLGSGRDQVKQLGNAVTPPVMEWLVQQVVASLS